MSSPITCIKVFRSLLLAALMLLPQWAAAESVESAVMPGKVIEGHAKYEVECSNCHKRFNKSAQTGLCLDCHKETAADVRGQKGYHGRNKDKEKECRDCHTEHKGRDAKIAEFDRAHFDHDETDYALEDKHKTVKCVDCHKPKKKYREAPAKCDVCHAKDDVHKGKLGNDCAKCHDAKDWKKSSFDHEKTKLPLIGGKHEDVECKKCHTTQTYTGAPKECVGCHRKDDQDKGHKGRYGTKCESCHNDRDWKEIIFDHGKDTRFALRGKHQPVKCDDCHLPAKGDLYKQKLPVTCVSCHRKDDQEKGHRGSLGDKCENCHNDKDWKTSSFDHDKDTKYPLKGKHRDAKCETCHKEGVTGKAPRKKLETTCIGCHRKDDQKKGHEGKYGDKCESCHTEKDWKTLIFDHDRDTKYKLLGKHRKTACKDCHPFEKPLYGQKLATTCISCHRKDDLHKNQLGSKCESCHKEDSWKDAPYDHAKAKFALTGSHIKLECKKCHKTPAFQDAETTCVECHQKDDVHKKRLGSKCEDCHNARSWKSWNYDHERRAKYKLDGAHLKIGCVDCHKKPVEKKFETPKTCGGCHADRDVHDGAFGQDCERCHFTDNFTKLKDEANIFSR